MDFLTTIALLCQVTGVSATGVFSSNALYSQIEKIQLECQKKYIQCYRQKMTNTIAFSNPLADCILEKK